MKKRFEAPVLHFLDMKTENPPAVLKDAIIAEAILAGKSQTEAGKLAYPNASPGAASVLAHRRLKSDKGLAARLVARAQAKILAAAQRRHLKLLSANSVTPMSTPNGIVRVEVPDNKTRLGAVKLSYEASGLVGEKASATQPTGPSLNMSVNLLSGEPPVIIEWVMREGRLPSPQERSVLLSGPVCPPATEEPSQDQVARASKQLSLPDPPDPSAPRKAKK